MQCMSEEEPAPAITRAAAAASGLEIDLTQRRQQPLKAGAVFRGIFNGTRWWFRLDKKYKKGSLWSVGLCNKNREECSGEQPRATGGVHKMTEREIREAAEQQEQQDAE